MGVLHFYNLLERFFTFPLHVLQFYNLLERFFKLPLHVQHFYLRGFSSFLSMFYIFKSTRGFYKFSSPQFYILQSTKRSIFPLHNSIFHQETLVFSQHFYTPQPTMSNPHTQTQEIKSRMKTFNNQENLAKRMRKNQCFLV